MSTAAITYYYRTVPTYLGAVALGQSLQDSLASHCFSTRLGSQFRADLIKALQSFSTPNDHFHSYKYGLCSIPMFFTQVNQSGIPPSWIPSPWSLRIAKYVRCLHVVLFITVYVNYGKSGVLLATVSLNSKACGGQESAIRCPHRCRLQLLF